MSQRGLAAKGFNVWLLFFFTVETAVLSLDLFLSKYFRSFHLAARWCEILSFGMEYLQEKEGANIRILMENIVGKYREVLLKQPLVDFPEQNLHSVF